MTKQTDEDFKRLLAEQIHFLQKSAIDYDKGDFLEAKQMSVRLRVLLHDTPESVSLLTHLGRKDIEFYDTSTYDENNIFFCDGLVLYKFGFNPPSVTFIPPLGGPGNCYGTGGLIVGGLGVQEVYPKSKVPFNDWWNNTIIDDKQGNILSRKDLVLAVCNQDGGAHVDAELKEAYASSINKRPNVYVPGGQIRVTFISNIVSANIRQITYEVLKTLEDEFPEYFSVPNEVLTLLEDRLPKDFDVTNILPPRDENRNFVLPVSPKPKPDSGANIVSNFTSDGPDNYLCGKCEAVMCRNITRGQMTKSVIVSDVELFCVCHECGAYHNLTTFESRF
jgi:hypothetical protein